MSKYIDADKLIAEIEKRIQRCEDCERDGYPDTTSSEATLKSLRSFIDSLQQEQPNDVCAEIKEYYGEELAFEDERAKAAHHFFSAGKAFELKEYEEERGKHITDLLDNFQKGMNAGYEKAISELKEGKVECSPVMKEFMDKLLNIGNKFNFGFGTNDSTKEQPDFPTTDEQVQEFLDTHPKVEVPEKYETSDWLFSKQDYESRSIVSEDTYSITNNTNKDEVLERELVQYCKQYYNFDYPNQSLERGSSVMPHILEAARYFWHKSKDFQYQKDRLEFAKLKAKEWLTGFDEGYEKGINAKIKGK